MLENKKYAFEDFTPGTVFHLGPYPVSAEEIIAFASEFDPQPMHLDEDAGKQSLLGGLAASGWHTCCMLMRMMIDSFVLDSASQGAPGVDFVQWKKPVLAGDILHGTSTVLSSRTLQSRPGLGLVQMRQEVFNQRDELVAASENPFFVLLRNKGGSA